MEILYSNEIKEIERVLKEEEEVLVNFKNKTVHLQYSEEGFDYSIFDSSLIFDEDGEIDFDLCLDGGLIEVENEDTAIRNVFMILNDFNI